MREYRSIIVNNGQASPDYLNDFVVECIEKIKNTRKFLIIAKPEIQLKNS